MSSDDPNLDPQFEAVYAELRRLANKMQEEAPNHTLNPTALVNEAYLKLAVTPPPETDGLVHFKRIVVKAMRQVLVDWARRRKALKRGSEVDFVTLNDTRMHPINPEEMLALHEALEALAQESPRQASVVEFKFFGGYSEAEIADLIGVSEPTVTRDWRAARAWLGLQLRSS